MDSLNSLSQVMSEVEDESEEEVVKGEVFDMFQSCISATKRNVNDLSYRSNKNSILLSESKQYSNKSMYP